MSVGIHGGVATLEGMPPRDLQAGGIIVKQPQFVREMRSLNV